MTTSSDPTGDGQPDAAPYLPPSQPTGTGAPAPSAAVIDHGATEAPFVPAPAPVAAPPAQETAFDAKAMVESQKRVNDNPAYGGLPTGTESSREASKKLRAKAQRKRTRNKLFARVVAVVLLVAVVAAGWFAFQTFQDDQDQDAAEREAAPDDDRSASEILEDLGSQGQMIDAQDALNDAVVPSAGGLGGAIDDAREVVGGLNDDPAGSSAPTPFTYDVVVPPVVRTIGERLPDATGRETYVVSADEFAERDPDGFALFIRLMGIQPQLIPAAEAFAGLPVVDADEIIISVERNGDRIVRAIVVGEDVNLRVDVTP